MRDLNAAALAGRNDAELAKCKSTELCGPGRWWDSAAMDPCDTDNHLGVKRRKLGPSGPIHLNIRPPEPETLPNARECCEVELLPEPVEIMDMPTAPSSEPMQLQCTAEANAQEPLDLLRSQYFEALYLSKVSGDHQSILKVAIDGGLRPPWATLSKDLCHERGRNLKRRQWLRQTFWRFYVPAYSPSRCLT